MNFQQKVLKLTDLKDAVLLHWQPRTNKTAVFAKRARAMAQEIYSHVYINLPKIAKKLANFHTHCYYATFWHLCVFFLQTKFGKGPILDEEKHPNRVSLPKNALVFHFSLFWGENHSEFAII